VRKLLGKTVKAADVDSLLAEPSSATAATLTTASSSTTASQTPADGLTQHHVMSTDSSSSVQVGFICKNYHDWSCVLAL